MKNSYFSRVSDQNFIEEAKIFIFFIRIMKFQSLVPVQTQKNLVSWVWVQTQDRVPDMGIIKLLLNWVPDMGIW